MRKTDCSECMDLFRRIFAPPGGDIPETERRTLLVWQALECQGNHTLDMWVAELPREEICEG